MGWSRLHYKCIAIIQTLVQNLKEKFIHTSAYFSRLFLSFLFTYRSVRVQTVEDQGTRLEVDDWVKDSCSCESES